MSLSVVHSTNLVFVVVWMSGQLICILFLGTSALVGCFNSEVGGCGVAPLVDGSGVFGGTGVVPPPMKYGEADGV